MIPSKEIYWELCACISDEALELLRRALNSGYSDEPTVEAIRALLDIMEYQTHGIAARGAWNQEMGNKLAIALDEVAERNGKQ